ncbi:hypothetical protein HanIR_Chr11g0507461 [Helianthus annuus]|nr:hypothetical protein HanIR_Chr11g0507461 [Helianthus annuus]
MEPARKICNCHIIIGFWVSFGIISSLTVLGHFGGEFGELVGFVNIFNHSVCYFDLYEH